MNDTVMKAHQNQDMTYDEMNDLWNVNEAAHPARGNLLSIYGIINDLTVQRSTSLISVQGSYITVRPDRSWLSPIVGETPSGLSNQI